MALFTGASAGGWAASPRFSFCRVLDTPFSGLSVTQIVPTKEVATCWAANDDGEACITNPGSMTASCGHLGSEAFTSYTSAAASLLRETERQSSTSHEPMPARHSHRHRSDAPAPTVVGVGLPLARAIAPLAGCVLRPSHMAATPMALFTGAIDGGSGRNASSIIL